MIEDMSITPDYHEAIDNAIQKQIRIQRKSEGLELLACEISIRVLRDLRRDFYELDGE